MRALLLVNPRAGRGPGVDTDELRAEAERRGVETRVLSEGEDPAAAARAADDDVIGAAGGDGSIASVAALASRRRRGEVLAGVRALWLGLRERRGVWAQLDGRPVSARVLLVASNAYELSLFSIGERARLDDGRLYLYTATGWLPRDWQEQSAERFTIEAPGPLRAAIDGEPEILQPPLEFSIEPRALCVLLPRAPG